MDHQQRAGDGYTFISSDGANSRKQTVTFESAGSRTVHTSWTLGRSYKGWVAVKILSPNPLESNHAEFSVDCGNSSGVGR